MINLPPLLLHHCLRLIIRLPISTDCTFFFFLISVIYHLQNLLKSLFFDLIIMTFENMRRKTSAEHQNQQHALKLWHFPRTFSRECWQSVFVVIFSSYHGWHCSILLSSLKQSTIWLWWRKSPFAQDKRVSGYFTLQSPPCKMSEQWYDCWLFARTSASTLGVQSLFVPFILHSVPSLCSYWHLL